MVAGAHGGLQKSMKRLPAADKCLLKLLSQQVMAVILMM